MTELFKINRGNHNSVLGKCAAILRNGGIVVYPTESSYAIGADAMNGNAVAKVRLAKCQSSNKALSVIVSDTKMAMRYAELDAAAMALAAELMPGPITLVVKKKKGVPDVLSRDTIGFRIPKNAIARGLCAKFGGAITATSANKTGMPPVFSGREAFTAFRGIADAIIDAGTLPSRKPSTLFDVGQRHVLREGPVKIGKIKKVLGEGND